MNRFQSYARLLIVLLLLLLPQPARAAGTTWTITSISDDVTDGDAAARTGSLRFILAHVQSGETVHVGDLDAETISIGAPLVVPAGVALGAARSESCTGYNTPKITIADPSLYPATAVTTLISLGAGATLRNIALLAGKTAIRIVGGDVDICGVGIGRTVGGDGDPITRPPWNTAIVIDGPSAVVHRSYIGGQVSITVNGSGARIGDAIGSSGDANGGIRAATVVVGADATSAARNVTIRDPFPRALIGIAGAGVAGGDDQTNHANHWAQRPTITRAITSDNFATMRVDGSASPHALVDIFLDAQSDVTLAASIVVGNDGTFSFSGPLPGSNIKVFAISTLDDTSHPSRIGSSSELSGIVQVIPGTATPTIALEPAALTFNGTVAGANPPAQPLLITASGGGTTLGWNATITTTGGGDWLSIAPQTGIGDGQASVSANTSGMPVGTYHGTITVVDQGNPARSASTAVILIIAPPAEPLLAATGSIINLTTPASAVAQPGDLIRFTVTLTNVGSVPVTNIGSNSLQLPVTTTVISGSGAFQGGSGFSADDSGFSGGTLAIGTHATYTLDLRIAPAARLGSVVIRVDVGGNGSIIIPVVGRIQLVATPANLQVPRVWLPFSGFGM